VLVMETRLSSERKLQLDYAHGLATARGARSETRARRKLALSLVNHVN
jgi:hypothetical protein